MRNSKHILTLAAALACAVAVAAAPAPAAAQTMSPVGGSDTKARAEGPQRPRPARSLPAPVDTHLHVVLRVTPNGEAEVVKAAELPGPAVFSDAPIGNYAYEVSKDGKTLAVESLIDPFQMRSFPPQGADDQGHHFERAASALVVVKVPHARLADADLGHIQVVLHRLRPEVKTETMNPAELTRVKDEGQVEAQWNLAAGQLAAEIRAKGRKVETQ